VNHNQDIDDGTAVFEEERERAACEDTFRNTPALYAFTFTFPEQAQFLPERVMFQHLRGAHTLNAAKPFDFEEGVAEIRGRMDERPGTLHLRWSLYGRAHTAYFNLA
jgi:hypothetical protein